MSGYGYGYGLDSRVGQEYDPSPPRLQAYVKHAQSLVTARAAQMPTTPFFVWILDADGREYVHPFSSSNEMAALLRRKSQPSRNFYYMAVFNRTGPVWPAPESSAYGCHAPEWNTWPSEFPPQPGPCPSAISGWPWGYVGQAPPTAPQARSAPTPSQTLIDFRQALQQWFYEINQRLPSELELADFVIQAALSVYWFDGFNAKQMQARLAELMGKTFDANFRIRPGAHGF